MFYGDNDCFDRFRRINHVKKVILQEIFTVMHVGDFFGTTLQCAVLTLFNNLCITLVVCQTKPYEQLSSNGLISKEKVSFDLKLKIQIYTLFLYYLPMSYVLVLFLSYLFPKPPSVFFSSVFCNSCILLAISYFLMVWVSMIDPVVWIKLYWIFCCIFFLINNQYISLFWNISLRDSTSFIKTCFDEVI